MRDKKLRRFIRKLRIRKKISGTPERPRLTIYKSNRYLYAQIVDDENNKVLAAASTLEKTFPKKEGRHSYKNKDYAKQLGELIAKRALEKGITKVVFDRNGYKYHGRLKALADAARAAGLKF